MTLFRVIPVQHGAFELPNNKEMPVDNEDRRFVIRKRENYRIAKLLVNYGLPGYFAAFTFLYFIVGTAYYFSSRS